MLLLFRNLIEPSFMLSGISFLGFFLESNISERDLIFSLSVLYKNAKEILMRENKKIKSITQSIGKTFYEDAEDKALDSLSSSP